jgi:hypothetical protein
MAADHLYLAAERAALTERLGVRWGPVDERSGAAEIVGLDDQALIERFSKRSEQLHEWLAEQGLSGIKASSAAAVATRAPKDHRESEASVYERWAAELAEQGVGERQLAAVCQGGRGRPAARMELDAALDALAGPDGLTGQASTFTRTDVVEALAKRLPVAASAQQALGQVEAAADRFLEERAVRVGRDRRLGVDRYSTPELLALERQLVDGATQRADERCAVVRPELVRQVLDRHSTAGEDQVAMVRDLAQGGAGVALVVGRAGSGKTWALGLAREAFELAGYQVLGTAPPASPPSGWPTKASARRAPSTGSCSTSATAEQSWTTARCWWWTRPPWSPPANSPRSLSMRSGWGQGGAGRRRPPVRVDRGRRRLPRPPPPVRGKRTDRQPPASRGVGAARH